MRLPITFRAFNSGGKGGQHGNRSLNAIEASVTLPDGRVVKAVSQTMKSQHQNRKLAAAMLLSRVRDALRSEEARRYTQGFGSDERVRTYHQPDNRVVDHASGDRRSWDAVVGGDSLGDLIEARARALAERTGSGRPAAS